MALSLQRSRKVIFPKESPSIYLDLSIISQGRNLCGQGSTILPEISCICDTEIVIQYVAFQSLYCFHLDLRCKGFLHIYRVRNETFCFSHGDCVMHRLTQLAKLGAF